MTTAPTASVRASQSRPMATRGRNWVPPNLNRALDIGASAVPRRPRPLILQAISHRLHSGLQPDAASPALRSRRRVDRRGPFRRVARLVRVLLHGPLRTAGAARRRHGRRGGEHGALLRVRAASQRPRQRQRQAHRYASSSPPELERSLYTWVASLLFLAVCTWWQPVPGVLYRARGTLASLAWLTQLLGVLLTIRASNALDVLDLAGVRQVERSRGSAPEQQAPPR